MQVEIASIDACATSGGTTAKSTTGSPVASIAAVKELLRSALGEAGPLSGIFEYVQRTPGKWMRAKMLLASTHVENASAIDQAGAVRAAAAVEVLQDASLIHDDLCDGSLTRRGVPSVGAAFGVRAAAAAGAYLAGLGIAWLAEVAAGLRIDMNCLELRTLAEGQLIETLPYAGRIRDLRAHYIDVVQRKTAPLFRLACRIGAQIGHGSVSAQRALAAFADHFALAFQVADDVRDLEGGKPLGKAAGTDLAAGVVTWPLLDWAAAERCPMELLAELGLGRRAATDAEALRLRVLRSGALAHSRRFIEQQLKAADRKLLGLPISPTLTFFSNLVTEVRP